MKKETITYHCQSRRRFSLQNILCLTQLSFIHVGRGTGWIDETIFRTKKSTYHG